MPGHERLKQAGRIVARVFHRSGEPIKDFRGAWHLERDGVSRSAAMAMVGHKAEAIYRRYAIVAAGARCEAAAKIDRAAAG